MIFLGSIKNLQDAVNMVPSQLEHYTRKCYRDGCKGNITVTKEIGQHLLIETNVDTCAKTKELQFYIKDIPEIINVSHYM